MGDGRIIKSYSTLIRKPSPRPGFHLQFI